MRGRACRIGVGKKRAPAIKKALYAVYTPVSRPGRPTWFLRWLGQLELPFLLYVADVSWRRRILGSPLMISRRPIGLSIIIASAISLGAYGIYLKHIDPTAADSPQTHPLVSRSADAQQTTKIGKSSSKSDAVQRGDVLPTIESSPPLEETLQNTAAPDEPYSTRESKDPGLAGDPAPEGEAPIGVLLNSVVHRLGVDGHHDLLRFILDEEIKESGLDSDAALSIETAILEVAGARGNPSEVRSGVSDIQCTASLCTFLVESGGAFQMTRMSPEFQAMLEQGPVSMIWWVGLGTRERQGHVRLYMYRPDIEQHWGLLEAVLAGP